MFYLFLRERKRDRVWAGEGRDTHRIRSSFQALSCQHSTCWGAQTHELWDDDLSWSWTLNWLSHPGALDYSFWRETSPMYRWQHSLKLHSRKHNSWNVVSLPINISNTSHIAILERAVGIAIYMLFLHNSMEMAIFLTWWSFQMLLENSKSLLL